ncbi:MAG TPA: protein kinase [Thermoanaerobaculia bacterium]|jgi:predicted esterase
MELTSGSDLSRYRLGDKLGAGGMGVVYRAFDTRLERPVALKVLPPEAVGDASRRERFVREAKAASALNHPHIVTVFDIDRVATATGEVDLLAMELVDGEPLDDRLGRGALPIAEALELAIQLTDALAAAHRAGIVHRDVKPGNLMVTASGQLKLLDFGLARTLPGVNVDPTAATVPDGLTMTGAVVGTPAYMSPEQALGRAADARSDVFAAGCVVYEMLAGRRPFAGEAPMDQLVAVVKNEPAPLRGLRAEVPPALERIVARCLAKDPTARCASGAELHAELVALRAELFAPRATALTMLRRPTVALPLAAALVAAVALLAWWAGRARDERRARARIAEVERLVERHDLVAAYLLVRELAEHLPNDRELERLMLSTTLPYTIRTTPPGARVSFRGYLDAPDLWHPLGTAPIERLRLPASALVFRAELAGYAAAEGAPYVDLVDEALTFAFELVPEASAPEGMVRIPAGRGGYQDAALDLGAFWLGRFEVTNREFQRFVDAGGYRDRSLWREPIEDGDRRLIWEEASALLVDSTGRPGPSTWRFGAYPEGLAEHPVGGVSWFEADAYARWAGGELPTLHHWFLAAQPQEFAEILQRGNFSGAGTVPVGSTHAVGPYGTYDMAGNVFEWTATGGERGQRYLAGGAWNEPNYTYSEPGAVSPIERDANRGLRLARFESEVPAAAREPFVERPLDPSTWTPVDEATFTLYRGLFSRPRGELRATVDGVDEVSPHYRWERVSFDAGYGGERLPAHLLLPRNAAPPYQVVLYFPPSPAERLSSSQTLDGLPWFEYFVRGGRAILFPVYQNTYERRLPGWHWSLEARRDLVLQWSKEIGRAIDYLETRPDVDREKIAFYGFSLGAVWGPVLTAVEPRIRVNLFLGGGVTGGRFLPEVDPVNFAPRVTVPTLFLTGKDDFVRPIATHQEPLLRLLGTPADQKKIAAFDGGHVPSDRTSVAREALAWLDRWLGPVETRAPAP